MFVATDPNRIPDERPSGTDPAANWMPPLEESDRPLEEQLPPTVLATPSHLPPMPAGPVTWWQPSWRDAWQHVGWRWIFLIPAALVVLLGIAALLRPWVYGPVLLGGWHFAVAAAAIAVSLAGYVLRRAARARKEPFCIYCGYNLSGLPDNYRCPECGRPYTWHLIAEYRRDPRWFVARYKAHQQLPAADAPFEAGTVRRKPRDGTA